MYKSHLVELMCIHVFVYCLLYTVLCQNEHTCRLHQKRVVYRVPMISGCPCWEGVLVRGSLCWEGVVVVKWDFLLRSLCWEGFSFIALRYNTTHVIPMFKYDYNIWIIVKTEISKNLFAILWILRWAVELLFILATTHKFYRLSTVPFLLPQEWSTAFMLKSWLSVQ